ncbi:hypothetical protein VitviT2T_015776 [Vitis vinifera]|uniref:Uncharacterized protein n=1 Tax=Vitis vinifera TaxID=29760 RepID=A0ABY9CPG4_VITVI|nr:hypothetical protein VitviT2T_015776 [Vitis vinifera]
MFLLPHRMIVQSGVTYDSLLHLPVGATGGPEPGSSHSAVGSSILSSIDADSRTRAGDESLPFLTVKPVLALALNLLLFMGMNPSKQLLLSKIQRGHSTPSLQSTVRKIAIQSI